MGARVLTFGFSLLMVAVAVGDGQLQRPPVRPTPYPPICKNNEEYQQCGCLRTCCNGGKPQGCAAQCTSGCFCKDGLVRNKNGVCIPLKDCNKTSGPTPSCGVDEEYYDCVPTCRDTCETYNSKAAICPEYCRSGCFCKKGWVKNSVGKCVPTSQCNPPTEKPPRCPKDEEFYADCAPSCTGTCENYNKSGIFNCPLCRPGCWCKKGLVRAKDGKCIAPSKCDVPTEECKGYNEVLVDCAKPKWCNTCGIKGNCKLSKCDKGCDCKPNYYRNGTGICIPESQCPGSTPSCGEDEVYYKDCAPSCTGSCDTYGKEAVILCPICRPGCWCKQGLVKNKDGKCIPFSQCDNKPEEECGAGEEYQECGTLCPRTCANLPYQIRCIAGCKRGCFCKEGLVRNYNNVCVKPEQCENKQCKVNEEYQKCGNACPETCSSLGKPQLCSTHCVSGCFCQEGFVKDDNGVCVEPSECPTEKCGVHEKYTTCGSACPETCENKDKTIFCTLQCVPGCFCIKGFVKNAQGKCINESQCEPSKAQNTNRSLTRTRYARSSTEQCGVNEIYKDCGSACPATCSNRGKRQVCTQQCVKGCFCKNGYIKNSDGRCVKPNECPKNQCGIDEVYDDCGTACPRTCASLYTKIRCIERCVPGCFCRDDLVRHNGKCIDIRECQTQQCGANEEYKKCGSACTATCSNLDKPQVCTDQCVTGCFCKEGFVKNDNGECVEPSKCPSKTCGKNEEYTTCGPCVRTCDNKDKEISCTQECRTGCFCKEGYVRNKENKCVLPDQCPSACNGYNEAFVDCVKPKSCNTCEIRGNCKLKKCDKGCDCKPDFYRNASGVCIPEAQCPVISEGHSEGFDCDKGPDTGPCKAYMPRFYYDQESGTCKPFIYGGCRGNKNNFMTEDQCRKRCGGVPERPDCDEAPDAGPCLASIRRFYYDENSNECKPFTYGGCLGNSNNFVSRDDCYKKCGSKFSEN